MGSNNSKQSKVKYDEHFFQPYFKRLSVTPSAFYHACKEGDIDYVRQHLSTNSHDKIIRQVEPNGDTALHAATRAGHVSIVTFLLANGFSRIAINRERKTAYEIESNDEIRRLFYRSVNELQSRFHDKNADETLSIFNNNTNEVIFNNSNDTTQSQYINRFNRLPRIFRNVVKAMAETRCIEEFEKIISDLGFLSNNITGDRILIKSTFDDYLQTKNIINLIHLYTLNDIYKAIRSRSDAYTTLVYLHLTSMSKRAYQGISYRGVKMSIFDVSRYYYAMKNANCIIETRNFASTSKRKNVSLIYSAHGEALDHNLHSILLIFEFPTRCKTAIDLTRISENLPPISQYADEEEVLILPYTLFKVLNVFEATQNEPFSIYLQNIPVPDQSLISFLKMEPEHVA